MMKKQVRNQNRATEKKKIAEGVTYSKAGL